MKAPAGLVGASLLLWGVAIELPWLGAALGIGFEALRAAAPPPSAWAAAQVAKALRGCAALALAALAWWVVTLGVPQALYRWLRWLPLLAIVLPVLQLRVDRLTLGDLRHARRPSSDRPPNPGPPGDEREVDLTHLHAALTLAAAGTGTGAQGWLYTGFVFIVGWALWARQVGQPAGRRIRAAAMVGLASGVGLAVHVGIAALQGQVEAWGTELLADWFATPPDPFRERTRIGELGTVKLSDRIVMRVRPEGPRPVALLLRESIFDRYAGGEWQTLRRAARPATRLHATADGPGDTSRWLLHDGAATARLVVRRSLPGGEGLLPLPLGTRSVDALPALAVDVLPTGTVRARGTPRFITIGVEYDAGAEAGAPDAAVDLDVPLPLAATLARVLAQERLAQATPAATVAAVHDFFGTKYAYTLSLSADRPGAAASVRRTLADFLLRDRRGHCEYFATATVLLLRQAGIPARYVGGYSVQEYSALEQAFVVRARHAHAWAQAWVDGRWVDVDTTPPQWAELEGEAAHSAFGPLLDAASWLLDQALQAWLALAGRASTGAPWAWVAAALGVVLALSATALAARLGLRRLRSRRGSGAVAAPDDVALAWAQVERWVAQAGHARGRDETVRAWLRRLDQDPGVQRCAWRASLLELGQAYYRVRFDPAAHARQRHEFIRAAQRWTRQRGPLAHRLRRDRAATLQ